MPYCAVTASLNRHLDAVDAREALENACESILTEYYDQFHEALINKGEPVQVARVMETVTLHWLVRFMDTEEYTTEQALYWLACKQAVWECDGDYESSLTGWQVINYAKEQGYF